MRYRDMGEIITCAEFAEVNHAIDRARFYFCWLQIENQGSFRFFGDFKLDG
jgi:hypothetical protein